MNQTERLYRIENLLHHQTIVPRAQFLAELEVSYATFKRDLAYLRDRLHAPIDYDADRRGYRFGPAAHGPRHEIPGLPPDQRTGDQYRCACGSGWAVL